MLRQRGAHRRTAAFFAPQTAGKQFGGDVHDARYAPVLPAGGVRKERPAVGEGDPQHP